MLNMCSYLCVVAALALAAVSAQNTTTLKGYVVESHDVVTDDGYILGLKRIPYKRYQTSAEPGRPVVFLMHGFGGDWLNYLTPLPPDLALGYNMADAGFDVWLGNARGNRFSRRHVFLNPDDPQQKLRFFDFTWEEIGFFDLPAMIDYALYYTGNDKLHYIGGSQGGTTFLVMASMRPEYNAKIASANLLAGAGYEAHFPSKKEFAPFTQFADPLYAFTQAIGQVELTQGAMDMISPGGVDITFGGSKGPTNPEASGNMTESDNSTSGISGTSVKTLFHYVQNFRDERFQRFDYGAGNLAKYGSFVPPQYDLRLITSKMTMHIGRADKLVSVIDTRAMAAVIPHATVRIVARDTFGHSDYVLASDAKELVTNSIIKSIKNLHYHSVPQYYANKFV